MTDAHGSARDPLPPLPEHGADASVEALALGVAHDINNPLAGLMASLDMALGLLEDEVDAGNQNALEVRDLLRDGKAAAVRIQTVVRQLGERAGIAEPPPPSTTRPSRPKVPVGSTRKVRVLVVDDEPIVATALQRALRDEEVVVTDDAREAIARIVAGERFDVILCDLMMPGMTGMDLHDELHQVAPEQARSLIFLTGGALTKRAQDFIASTRHLVVEKPFDVAALRRLVLRHG